MNAIFNENFKKEDKTHAYLTDHTLSLLCNIVMDQTAPEYFLKHKSSLKDIATCILGLLNLQKVDSHTLILSIVVINQLYRNEGIKEYLDSLGVPDRISVFVESVSSLDMGTIQSEEKLTIAASERKTLLDLCAQIFQSME